MTNGSIIPAVNLGILIYRFQPVVNILACGVEFRSYVRRNRSDTYRLPSIAYPYVTRSFIPALQNRLTKLQNYGCFASPFLSKWRSSLTATLTTAPTATTCRPLESLIGDALPVFHQENWISPAAAGVALPFSAFFCCTFVSTRHFEHFCFVCNGQSCAISSCIPLLMLN